MTIKFTNFGYSTLAVGINSSATTLNVAGGHGARFPTLGAGDYFYATLENASLVREIVKVTARAVDAFTIVRAQDNTTAVAWSAGDSVALRLNAAAMTDFVPVTAAAVQAQTYTAFTTAGTSTAYTLTPAPAITAYLAGQSFEVTFHTACGAAPTLQISGIATPPNLVKRLADGTLANVTATDIPAGTYRVRLASATQAEVLGLNYARDHQSQLHSAFTTGGTSTAYTLTPNPAVTAYAANQAFWVTFHTASGAAPTLAISGVATPPNLVKRLGDGTLANIAANDIPAGSFQVVGVSATQYEVKGLPARRIGQIQTTSTGAVATGTTVIPHDDTIPQITEGDQYLSLSFTPINANSLLEIFVEINISHSVANVWQCAALFDGSANALNAKEHFEANGGNIDPFVINHTVSAVSTSARTYTVRAGSGTAGTTTVNGSAGTRSLGGVLISNMIIKEYLP